MYWIIHMKNVVVFYYEYIYYIYLYHDIDIL